MVEVIIDSTIYLFHVNKFIGKFRWIRRIVLSYAWYLLFTLSVIDDLTSSSTLDDRFGTVVLHRYIQKFGNLFLVFRHKNKSLFCCICNGGKHVFCII